MQIIYRDAINNETFLLGRRRLTVLLSTFVGVSTSLAFPWTITTPMPRNPEFVEISETWTNWWSWAAGHEPVYQRQSFRTGCVAEGKLDRGRKHGRWKTVAPSGAEEYYNVYFDLLENSLEEADALNTECIAEDRRQRRVVVPDPWLAKCTPERQLREAP